VLFVNSEKTGKIKAVEKGVNTGFIV